MTHPQVSWDKVAILVNGCTPKKLVIKTKQQLWQKWMVARCSGVD
jgi:hypothetical protein